MPKKIDPKHAEIMRKIAENNRLLYWILGINLALLAFLIGLVVKYTFI